MSFKEGLCQKVLFHAALLSENPATSDIGCYWQYSALLSSTFHKGSRKKWAREATSVGLSNDLASFLTDGRGAEGPTLIRIMKLQCECQTEEENDHWASLP